VVLVIKKSSKDLEYRDKKLLILEEGMI